MLVKEKTRQLPEINCPSPGTQAPRDIQREQKRKERGEITSFSPTLFTYLFTSLSFSMVINHQPFHSAPYTAE
jgi:hypothetical protein